MSATAIAVVCGAQEPSRTPEDRCGVALAEHQRLALRHQEPRVNLDQRRSVVRAAGQSSRSGAHHGATWTGVRCAYARIASFASSGSGTSVVGDRGEAPVMASIHS